MRDLRRIAAVVVIVGASLVVAQQPAGATGGIGASGVGDPYFPLQGNGGYNVGHYNLDVTYTPSSVTNWSGTATISATVTQTVLRQFDLDLRDNMVASSVSVNGVPATFSQPADLVQELVIIPAKALKLGDSLTVVVRYAGIGTTVIDPDGSLDGWIKSSDGVFIASEPQGSPSWFPVNDTPDDKATYAVSITVPAGLQAISNGVQGPTTTTASTSTYNWSLDTPVSSYLITATIGHFDLSHGTTPDGVPYLIATDPTVATATAQVASRLPKIIDFFSSVYGPYPFSTAGAIFDNAPQVGYELETATRPLFDRPPPLETFAHELAHQWYGDDVTLARWRDIWINEGFAEFSAWLWTEHNGGPTAASHLAKLLAKPASSDVWNPPPANPGGNADIFSNSVYERGAGTLEALREKLGDATFFSIMKGWLLAHQHGNAKVTDFEAYASSVSGQDLTAFFTNWLVRPGKPTS